jgi:hypothetical protein
MDQFSDVMVAARQIQELDVVASLLITSRLLRLASDHRPSGRIVLVAAQSKGDK